MNDSAYILVIVLNSIFLIITITFFVMTVINHVKIHKFLKHIYEIEKEIKTPKSNDKLDENIIMWDSENKCYRYFKGIPTNINEGVVIKSSDQWNSIQHK